MRKRKKLLIFSGFLCLVAILVGAIMIQNGPYNKLSYSQEYILGQDNIKGNVNVESFLECSEHFAIGANSYGNFNESSNTEQTSEASSNRQNYMTGYCSKDNVADFLSVFGEHELGGLSTGFVLDEEHCYNVTPDRIAEETSAQIFKFSDSCATFIYLDGQVYPFGEWFGGYGFVNAVPCDFDHDGNADILYTYSWGSGFHRSLVAVFNTQTMENTVIYDSADTDHPQVDLYISTQSPSIDIPDTEMTTYFVVYTVNIEVLEDNFANLGCVVTGIVGSVESENGGPVFHRSLYDDPTSPVAEQNYHIVNIVDRTKTEGLPYDTAEEKFFEDGDNEYYFSGIYSHYVIVHYEDGSEEDIVTALNAGRVTIVDLDKFEVNYTVRALDTEN